MIPKKSNKASLENKHAARFMLGLIISLSLILISFEWTSITDISSDVERAVIIDIDEQIIELIPREKEPPPKPELPPIAEVINIVTDEPDLPPFDPSWEVDDNTRYAFPTPPDEGEELPPEPEYFHIVEEMPLFNGGNPNIEFARFIAGKLRYPDLPAENGVSGKVFVQFDIDKNGSLVDPVIYRGVDPALDAEAIRVVGMSPPWTPGKQRGKAVKVRYVFPINFILK